MIIEYDLDIYSINIIKRAIIDYKDIVSVDLSLFNNIVECSFYDYKYNENLIHNEFNNYLINLLNQVQ